jgi:hypothetical protein
MKCPFSALDAFSYEGQQHTIFFFGCLKESADMPMLIESGCCQVNEMFDTIHEDLLMSKAPSIQDCMPGLRDAVAV